MAGSVKIHHLSTSFQGSYFFRWVEKGSDDVDIRKFSISQPDGETREVFQLHTEDWPDLGVPDGTRWEIDSQFRFEEKNQAARRPHDESPESAAIVRCPLSIIFSFPEEKKKIAFYLEEKKKTTPFSPDPILVHCSAGVGRTGKKYHQKNVEHNVDTENTK